MSSEMIPGYTIVHCDGCTATSVSTDEDHLKGWNYVTMEDISEHAPEPFPPGISNHYCVNCSCIIALGFPTRG